MSGLIVSTSSSKAKFRKCKIKTAMTPCHHKSSGLFGSFTVLTGTQWV